MRLIRTLTVVAIAAVALIALACGGDDGGTGGGDANAGVREIHLRMTDQVRFEPAEIQVEAGVPVRLVIDNGAYTADAGFFSQLAAMHALGPYKIPHVLAEAHLAYTNHQPSGSVRAPRTGSQSLIAAPTRLGLDRRAGAV